tara:strand:+ start:1639 stop:2001 length:363 start_codon:yes stop_codon:yes gene_type:complete
VGVKVTVANSRGLMQLVKDSKGRNRSVEEESLKRAIDPEGVHVMNFSMVHNDSELRTEWLVKLNDEVSHPGAREVSGMQFTSIWLDVGFDAFRACTVTMPESELGGTVPDPPGINNAAEA